LGKGLRLLGTQLARAGLLEDGAEAFTESVACLRRVDDRGEMGFALIGLANIELITGSWERARELSIESLDLYRPRRWGVGVGIRPGNLAGAAVGQSDFDAAADLYSEALEITRRCHSPIDVVSCLTGLAAADAGRGQLEAAAELLGSAEALWELVDVELEA